MRTSFGQQLDELEERIASSLDIAIETLREVAKVVADPAVPTPSSIERNAARLRDARSDLSQSTVVTMARQTPVASDLRLVLALMEISHHISLIANQFDLMTAQMMEIDPDILDSLGTGRKLSQMASLAAGELRDAASALRRRDPRLAERVGREDEAVNRLNRDVFEITAQHADDVLEREVALRHVMIARSLERIGDNAVDIAEQVVFLMTGEPVEFSDASRPSPRPQS